MAEQDQKNYELAYLLPPSIAEEEVLAHANKLNVTIESVKGIAKHAEIPRLRQLAYPIKKHDKAYFGWITFRMDPTAAAELDKKLRGHDLLRYMLLQRDERELRERPLFRERTAEGVSPAAGETPREQENKEEPLDLEALDKRLEEILGK